MMNHLTKALLVLTAAFLMSFLFPQQAQAASCGGENQKSCWSLNPKKWCNGDLKYVGNGKPGGGRCVRRETVSPPKSDCGGLNQKSCWSLNRNKWCNPGLKYVGNGKPGGGRCRAQDFDENPDCGGLNQKSCWSLSRDKWCEAGLKYVGNGKPGDGRCRAQDFDENPDCGGLNQKSCWSLARDKWCDKGLEYFGTGKPGDGKCIRPGSDPTPDCGGLNQKSCVNISPARWCDEGLEYFGTGKPGDGRCIRPGSDPTPDCGGIGQNSCVNINPARWCDEGLSYRPGAIAERGRCIQKLDDEDLIDASQQALGMVKRLGTENPMFLLRTCLMRPEVYDAMKEAMNSKSENGMNRVMTMCGASPQALINYGENVLGYAPKVVQIGIGGSAVAGIGIESGLVYALELKLDHPEGRYMVATGLGGGAGLSIGADVSVSLTREEMPMEHWYKDRGTSVNFSGGLLGEVGVSIDFPESELFPTGFTVSGGIGAGAEVGTVIHTTDQYLYNF